MTDLTTTPLNPTPPPDLSPGGRTALRAIVVIVAALALLCGVGGLTAAAVGIGNTRVIADNQSLPSSMRTLTIDTGAVPMRVHIESDDEAGEPRVEMRFVTVSQAGEQSLDIAAGTDTRIDVRGRTAEWLEWARAGELTVVLPPELARRLTVTTTQQLGVLDVDADLDRLVARSMGGAVILDGSARSIEAEVKHGAVVSHDPISVRETFSANVIEGDIEVQFRDVAPRTVDATSADGSVVLGLPGDGPFLVNAMTASDHDSAEVRVPQTANRDEAESVVTVRSSNGDVVIEQAR
ncbi:hypothetical protein BH10ACT9_BH10ACT9_36620 [soil metagenome]